jgi:tRNA1Val (adenine37-N6)-methyltransferase
MSSFQFKQFTIHQNQCAMKVSTDACVFGAYIPVENAKRIIDIGTGTGLLALMLAQRNTNAKIDAIEIDSQAAQQAAENVAKSNWKSTIAIINTSIQDFTQENQQKENQQNKLGTYDLVVSNPPFFVSSTLPPNVKQQVAHHTTALSFEELWQAVELLITPKGHFAVLLPLPESNIFAEIGKKLGFFATQQLFIQDSSKKNPHRLITIFQKGEIKQEIKQIMQATLVIKDVSGNYTKEFIHLLQTYYLYL